MLACARSGCLVESDRIGIGRGIKMPALWVGRKWQGTGSPVLVLVQLIIRGLRGELLLPSSAELDASCNLEASALRALDLVADTRDPVALHADDPFFMASSLGAMQEMLNFISGWAYKHKVTFHTSH